MRQSREGGAPPPARVSRTGRPLSARELRAPSPRVVRWSHGIVALLLGSAQAYANRHYVNADGMSYLDVADAWARGDWPAAVNAYWSPMYSWLLAIATAPVSVADELPAARLVNLVALAFAVYAADLLLRELRGDERRSVVLAAAVVTLWVLLALVGVSVLTPDLLLTGFTLVAMALLLRSVRDGTVRSHLLLGATLGLGYLAKAAMFPVALVALLIVGARAMLRRAFTPPLIAATSFAVFALPLVIALSVAKGRFTFGESGRINYAFYIGDVPAITHWRGGPGENGSPVHPTRQVWPRPAAFEFTMPVGGTYAPWYDPSYWYDGVSPRFSMRAHARQLGEHAPILASVLWPALSTLFITLVLGGAARDTLRALGDGWPLALACGAALGMFALVYLEERYIAGFLLALLLWIVSALRTAPGREWALPLALVVFAAKPAIDTCKRAEHDAYAAAYSRDEPNPHADIARRLREHGVSASARIALIGTGARAYWARVAGVRIVAEVPDREVLAFWDASPVTRDSVLQAMARASGATSAITSEPPARYDTSGWVSLGAKGMLIRALEAEPLAAALRR